MKVKPLKWKKYKELDNEYVARSPLGHMFRIYENKTSKAENSWSMTVDSELHLAKSFEQAKKDAEKRWNFFIKELEKQLKSNEKILAKCYEGE